MIKLYLIALVVGVGAIIWSSLRTSVANGDMWREKAKSREQVERIEPARRGTIYSADGKVLATTVPVCDLCLDLGRWAQTDEDGNTVYKKGKPVMEGCVTNDSSFRANLPKVCRILHDQFPAKSVQYYYDRIMNEYMKDKPSRCLYVERRVPYSQWDAIRQLPGWTKCVVTKTSEGSVTSYVRAHIYGNLGENTIGLHYKMVNADGSRVEGYTGLEGYYDSVLRGQDGQYLCRRLTRGTWLAMDRGDEILHDEDSTMVRRRIDGRSIVSTIDTRLQDIAESALRASMMKHGGQRGCAILMDVQTGYVLACSSLTRDTSGRVSENLWSNVACSDHYEPGSTFKVVAMTSMLEDRKIVLDTNKRVRAGGQKQYSRKSGIINDGHGYATDTANLAGVLARSSNIGMCELAWEYYNNRRDDFRRNIIRIFPFGKLNPDVQAPETSTGVVKFNSDRDFLNLSYGYSAMVTPLQLVTFYNAIAADGRMVKPLFCKEILDGNHRTTIQPVVLNEHICSAETAKKMREMLVGVVEHGTGSNIRNSVYGIGGKTGTSLDHADRSLHNSSFVGFFPADNPRYTCLVLIEKTSIAGREAAAPVFKEIADCVVAFDKDWGSYHLKDSAGRVQRPVVTKGNRHQLETIHQLLGMPFSIADSSEATYWVVYDADRSGYVSYTRPEGVVPDCHGMTIRDAMELLRSMGLKVRFSGVGKVSDQSPKPRSPIRRGGTVVLKLE